MNIQTSKIASPPSTPRSSFVEPSTPRPFQARVGQDKKEYIAKYLGQIRDPKIHTDSNSSYYIKRISQQIKHLASEILEQIKLTSEPKELNAKNITISTPVYLDQLGSDLFVIFFKQKFGITLECIRTDVKNSKNCLRYHFFEPTLNHLDLFETTFHATWSEDNRYLSSEGYKSCFESKPVPISTSEYEARKKQIGTDCVFEIKGMKIHAHTIKLQIHAPHFYEMYKEGLKKGSQTPVVISDHDPKTFEQFLEFIYLGKLDINIPEALLDMIKLFKLANEYKIERLMDWCLRSVDKQSSIPTILEKHYLNFLNLALEYKLEWLLNICLKEANSKPKLLDKLAELDLKTHITTIVTATLKLNLSKVKDSLLLAMTKIK